METIDTSTNTDRIGLLVTLGHQAVTTATEAQESLTDGAVIVTVTPTTEHAYFVRRYGDSVEDIFVKDDSMTRWIQLDPKWHLPAIIVYQPNTESRI